MARSKKEPEQIETTGQLYVEPLEKVLHSSMLPYAEAVILDRALPRVEDAAKAEKMITTLMGDKVEGRKEFLAKYANFNKRDSFMEKIEKTSKKENVNGEN